MRHTLHSIIIRQDKWFLDATIAMEVEVAGKARTTGENKRSKGDLGTKMLESLSDAVDCATSLVASGWGKTITSCGDSKPFSQCFGMRRNKGR